MERLSLSSSYILHARPFSESSLILEVFTQDKGRLGILARGVKRTGSKNRGLLQAFQPLSISAQGRGELLTLTQVEANGQAQGLMGRKLMCGLYLNEILLRLLAKADPHSSLFESYRATLDALTTQPEQKVLRLFERDLLEALGYRLEMGYCADSGDAIEDTQFYLFDPEQGFLSARTQIQDDARLLIKGASLKALSLGELDDPGVLQDAKRLLRRALNFHLGPKPLETRRLL